MKSEAIQGGVAAKDRHILAIFNPAAGRNRRRKFERVVGLLRAAGCTVTVRATAGRGDAERIAREAADTGCEMVAAAGGDGTVNEVVNGLAGTGLALGIIPLGTANVVADEIGLSKDPHEVARTLAQGPLRPIRVGRANGRRFVMMAGVGFDANVISRVSLALKKVIGPLAYVWTSAVQGFRDPFAHCAVTVDGQGRSAVSAVACKGRRYGGPFIAAPDANLAADSFQVVLMKGRGWFSVARYGAALIFGKVAIWSDVEIIEGRDVVISGTTGQTVQADGDIIAALPVRIEIDPEPLRVAFPR